MTSIQGTNTDFSSIANNWLYLNTDGSDRDYLTDVSVDYFIHLANINEPDTVSIKEREKVLEKYLTYNKTLDSLKPYADLNGVPKRVSFMDLLNTLNQQYQFKLSHYIALLKETNYGPTLKNNYNGMTLFVFKNDYYEEVEEWLKGLRPDRWDHPKNSLPYMDQNLKELLKYHTLNFKLYPSQLTGRKVQVGTALSEYISAFNKIEIESVYGRLYINLNKDYDLNHGGVGFYPSKTNRILIEKVVECDDGIIYIIDKPLIPVLY
jgi:hypothetical protein